MTAIKVEYLGGIIKLLFTSLFLVYLITNILCGRLGAFTYHGINTVHAV